VALETDGALLLVVLGQLIQGAVVEVVMVELEPEEVVMEALALSSSVMQTVMLPQHQPQDLQQLR
jgi:hypothetical protein